MEEKDKWIKNFHDRMEDYSEPVPKGVWKQLEQELGGPKIVPAWHRWRAAAAAVLMLLTSSLTVWIWILSSNNIGQQPVEMADVPVTVPAASEPDNVKQPVTQVLAVKGHEKSTVAVLQVTDDVSVNEVLPEEALEEQIEEKEPDAQKVIEETEATPAAECVGHPAVVEKKNGRYAYACARKKQGRGWSIGLAAGNSPFPTTTEYEGYERFRVPIDGNLYQNGMQSSSVDKIDPAFTVLSDYPTGTKESMYNQILLSNLSDKGVYSDVEHKMPITFGASLRFDLSGRWAIETGVVYTMLSSDLRSGSQKAYYEQEQRLHYVGIPLKLSREIWSGRRLEVYASAGGTVEKCVSGELQTTYVVGESGRANESEDIKIKPLQWSLSAAVGIQFKLTEKLGVYAEPGAVYYFDDGSEVVTIRKEHPLHFNIQLGVRFTLPK